MYDCDSLNWMPRLSKDKTNSNKKEENEINRRNMKKKMVSVSILLSTLSILAGFCASQQRNRDDNLITYLLRLHRLLNWRINLRK